MYGERTCRIDERGRELQFTIYWYIHTRLQGYTIEMTNFHIPYISKDIIIASYNVRLQAIDSWNLKICMVSGAKICWKNLLKFGISTDGKPVNSIMIIKVFSIVSKLSRQNIEN